MTGDPEERSDVGSTDPALAGFRILSIVEWCDFIIRFSRNSFGPVAQR